MEKQDTIADIIAEMRKSDCDEICPWWADGGSCDSCPLGRSGKNCSFSNFADRLEVAWKREKSAIEADALAAGGVVEAARATAEKSSAVGDAAKLREALKSVKRYLDGYTVNVLEMRSQVDAALAAPPRNCDMYGGDYRMLHTAWFDWTGSPSGQNPDGTVKLTFSEWLLEKAVRHDI